MRYRSVILSALLVMAVVVATSCLKEGSMSNKEREKISLDAWIRLHKPELVGNYQPNGGYYVEVLEWGDESAAPTSKNDIGGAPLMDQDTCWVYTNMTGRTMNGTICLTRSGELADLCGTYSYNTHYVPYYNYCGNTNFGLLEGTYLAMRNELVLSDWYVSEYWSGESSGFKMRKGSKVRLYMPSSIAYGEEGSAVEGGYEGQYTLSASTPMIMDVEVLGAVRNPSDKEVEMVSNYIKGGSNAIWQQAELTETEKNQLKEGESPLLTGLYYSLSYNPKSDDPASHNYIRPEMSGVNNPYTDKKIYLNMTEVNKKINQILLDRFGEGLSVSERSDATQVTHQGVAKVWYVLRFLDGFVVDTNIDEIRQYVYKDYSTKSEVFTYAPSDDDGSADGNKQAIGAWYYCISQMHHGSYGQIITTSGYAYGSTGITGTTTTTESSTGGNMSYYNPYSYYNYYNYYNSYYSGYNNYYDYYNYYNYNYNYSADDTETVTTRSIGTEILPYTPLIFTVFVEERD